MIGWMITMSRKELDHEIEGIRGELLLLAGRVEQATLQSANALKDHDLDGSRAILEDDRLINLQRFELEGTIITVIARQQPAAHDLRSLTAMLDICSELERMGDYAKGISAINLRSGGLGLPRILLDLKFMAEEVVSLLRQSMDAYMREDIDAAMTLAGKDDLIDALYRQIYYEAMDLAIADARNIERVNFVLWAAHNLERFADRVTNICERTVFVATGELKEFHLAEHLNPTPHD
jgi:phosphate transport system protein